MAAVLAPPAPAFEPRVRYDLAEADYHAIPALGSTDVRRLLRSPAHYRAAAEGEDEPSDAQQLGTAIHRAILEPERFEREVAVSPKFDRRTNAGKAGAEAFEREHAGKVILLADEHDAARRVADAVRAHPAAAMLLDEGTPEVSLQWVDEASGAPCKARLDFLRPDGVIVDLKSARDASPAGFARACGQYKLHVQAAHYMRGYRAVMRSEPQCWVMIALEKTPPFAVGVYALGQESIDSADDRITDALSRWADCAATSRWPAYSSLIEPIEVPPWAR